MILRNVGASVVVGVAVVEWRRVAVEVVEDGTTHDVLALTLIIVSASLLLLFLNGGDVGDDTTSDVVWVVDASSLLAELGEGDALDSAAQAVEGFGSGVGEL